MSGRAGEEVERQAAGKKNKRACAHIRTKYTSDYIARQPLHCYGWYGVFTAHHQAINLGRARDRLPARLLKPTL